MYRLTARDVMSHPVVSVHPETSIVEVVRTLIRERVSGVPVVDRLGRLVGVVTEGDILIKEAGPGGLPMLAYMGRSSEAERVLQRTSGTTAGDVMVTQVVTASQDTSLREIAGLMARHGINRVPIVRNGHVLGIVTRADVLKAFATSDQSLRAEVRQALREAKFDPDSLHVDVRDHVVMIRDLADEGDRSFVAALVGCLDGVAGVEFSQAS